MKTPDRTTARAFNRYLSGEVLADSAELQWTGLYVRLCRLPRVVDCFLVPATPEPLITCNAKGSAEFRERDLGGAWITRKIERRRDVRHPFQDTLRGALKVTAALLFILIIAGKWVVE